MKIINKENNNKLNTNSPFKIQKINIGAKNMIEKILFKKSFFIYQNFFLFLKIYLKYFLNQPP